MNNSAIPSYSHNYKSADSFEDKIKKMLQEYNEWKYNSHDFTLEELRKYASFWLEKSSKLEEIRYAHDSTDSAYWTWLSCYNWIVCRITKDVQNYYIKQLEKHVIVTSNKKESIIPLIQ